MSQDTLLYHGESLGPEAVVSGRLKSVNGLDTVESVSKGDIAYIPFSESSDNNVVLFYNLVRAGIGAIVCERLKRTDHGVLLANELGVPCVSSIPPSISDFENEVVTIQDGEVHEGIPSTSKSVYNSFEDFSFPETRTDIKVNVGFPEVVRERPELPTVTDGVGFLRLEFLLLDILDNIHPEEFIDRHGRDELIKRLANRLEPVLSSYSAPVWIRTNDFAVSQLRRMEGGQTREEVENNSMLGWRGISRSIDDPVLYDVEIEALKSLVESGHDNIGLFPPMTRFHSEYVEWRSKAIESGLEDVSFGLMVETPSAALTFEDFTDDIEFVVFGSNDLTQFTLAIDRNNQRLQHKFSEESDALLKLFERVISISNEQGIQTCIGGQAASNPGLAKQLISYGIDSLSVNPDYQTISTVRTLVSEMEDDE